MGHQAELVRWHLWSMDRAGRAQGGLQSFYRFGAIYYARDKAA